MSYTVSHQIAVQTAARNRRNAALLLRRRRRGNESAPEEVRALAIVESTRLVETRYRATNGLEFETYEEWVDGLLTDFDLWHRAEDD